MHERKEIYFVTPAYQPNKEIVPLTLVVDLQCQLQPAMTADLDIVFVTWKYWIPSHQRALQGGQQPKVIFGVGDQSRHFKVENAIFIAKLTIHSMFIFLF